MAGKAARVTATYDPILEDPDGQPMCIADDRGFPAVHPDALAAGQQLMQDLLDAAYPGPVDLRKQVLDAAEVDPGRFPALARKIAANIQPDARGRTPKYASILRNLQRSINRVRGADRQSRGLSEPTRQRYVAALAGNPEDIALINALAGAAREAKNGEVTAEPWQRPNKFDPGTIEITIYGRITINYDSPGKHGKSPRSDTRTRVVSMEIPRGRNSYAVVDPVGEWWSEFNDLVVGEIVLETIVRMTARYAPKEK